MTKKQSDELLIKALKKHKEEQFSSIPAESEIKHEFSETFNNKMKILFEGIPSTHSAGNLRKRILSIIVAALLIICTALSIGAFREKLVDFFYEVFYNNTHYLQTDFDDGYMQEYYTLPVIPDSFEKITELIDNIEVNITFINSYGSQICFVQSETGSDGSFNSEGSEISEIQVNGIDVLYCDNGRDIFCVWAEQSRNFYLIYPSYLTDSYMYDIVGHLKETKPIN